MRESRSAALKRRERRSGYRSAPSLNYHPLEIERGQHKAEMARAHAEKRDIVKARYKDSDCFREN